MGIAQDIDAAINLMLNNFVITKSEAVCAMLTPIALSALSIYWMLTGLAIAQGRHPQPMKEIIAKLFLASWVTALALSTGTYQLLVVGGLDAIGGAFIEAMSGKTTFAELMDNLADPFVILGSKLWSEATVGIVPRVALIFAAALCSLAQSILFSVGLGFYLLAKVSVALTFAVGPGFIFCAISPLTQKYAETWLGQTLNYIFLKVFVCVSVIMLTSFASQFAEHITSHLDTINIIEASCGLLLISIALVIVIAFHPQLASALFGGASVAGVGRAISFSLLQWLTQTVPSGSGTQKNTVRRVPSTPAKPVNTVRQAPLYQRKAVNSLQAEPPRSAK